ncbi:hypothetical protein COS16_10785 [Candidatus Desantisbacteria bacterium CG02_land_8_20_14_3_00_49_13]|nr:MAG: hypothetical protein COS16_10785 [Candidatus Desantisbacteria bacterium CG02_land_8_20_14_3_00_49_13]
MKLGEKGVALITGLIIIVLIAMISTALILTTTTQYRLGKRSRLDKVATNLAEAGVDYGIWRLNCTSGLSPVTFSETLGDGHFVVNITTPPTSIEGRVIDATGYTRNNEYRRRIVVRVEMAVAIDPYNFAAFGNNKNELGIGLTGNALVDSYKGDTIFYKLGHGDIGSNGDITLGGSADVNGTALLVTGNTIVGTVEDGVKYQDTYAALPDIPDFDDSITGAVTGDTTLDTGIYYFSYIDLSADYINLNGPVEIYVRDYINVTGNAQININNDNPYKDAARCAIYIKGGGNAVYVDGAGNCKIVASIYAPNGNVNVKGTLDLYGNVIANILTTTGNATIYFDENLKEKQKPIWWAAGATYCRVITSWQRF